MMKDTNFKCGNGPAAELAAKAALLSRFGLRQPGPETRRRRIRHEHLETPRNAPGH
jgi:hypothetical protein